MCFWFLWRANAVRWLDLSAHWPGRIVLYILCLTEFRKHLKMHCISLKTYMRLPLILQLLQFISCLLVSFLSYYQLHLFLLQILLTRRKFSLRTLKFNLQYKFLLLKGYDFSMEFFIFSESLDWLGRCFISDAMHMDNASALWILLRWQVVADVVLSDCLNGLEGNTVFAFSLLGHFSLFMLDHNCFQIKLWVLY